MACDSLVWIDGVTYTANNNSATHHLTNSAGCDSLVTLDLTIIHGSSSTDTHSACDRFTWIDGNTYTSSNTTATYTGVNTAGCDSVVTLNLTIIKVDKTTTTAGAKITSNQAGGTYQWIDCGNGFKNISGATKRSYTALVPG